MATSHIVSRGRLTTADGKTLQASGFVCIIFRPHYHPLLEDHDILYFYVGYTNYCVDGSFFVVLSFEKKDYYETFRYS